MWTSTGSEGSSKPSVEMPQWPFGGTGLPSLTPPFPTPDPSVRIGTQELANAVGIEIAAVDA